MEFVKTVLWLFRQRWPSKVSRYTFLWGIVNVAAAAAAPSPEGVPQHGLSGGEEALQSSHEMWSQKSWPLDKYLLCLNEPDSGEQVLSMLQSSHLLEEMATTHPRFGTSWPQVSGFSGDSNAKDSNTGWEKQLMSTSHSPKAMELKGRRSS